MSTTDKIALTALIVSVFSFILSLVAGILNYLYTRRTFQHTFHPRIQADIECKVERHITLVDLYQTDLLVHLKNVGNKVIENVEVVIKVANPTRRWKLWQPYWVCFRTWKSPKLEPTDSTINLFEQQGFVRSDSCEGVRYQYLEEFLEAKFPQVVHKEKETFERTDVVSDWYKMPKQRTLKILLTERHFFSGKVKRGIFRTYKLIPQLEGKKKTWLIGWRIELVSEK